LIAFIKLIGVFGVGASLFVVLCIAGDTGTTGNTGTGVDVRVKDGGCKGILTRMGAGAGAGAGAGTGIKSGISKTSLIISCGVELIA
jgi:hypothetical protein